MTPNFDAKFEEKVMLFQKRQEFESQVLESLRICTFNGSYCAKYLMFDLKKYRGVILHDTEE